MITASMIGYQLLFPPEIASHKKNNALVKAQPTGRANTESIKIGGLESGQNRQRIRRPRKKAMQILVIKKIIRVPPSGISLSLGLIRQQG